MKSESGSIAKTRMSYFKTFADKCIFLSILTTRSGHLDHHSGDVDHPRKSCHSGNTDHLSKKNA